jgi:hypothetical protein
MTSGRVTFPSAVTRLRSLLELAVNLLQLSNRQQVEWVSPDAITTLPVTTRGSRAKAGVS